MGFGPGSYQGSPEHHNRDTKHQDKPTRNNKIMPNNERTPLLAGDDDSIMSKVSAASGGGNNKDPEALADGPKIPGIKLSVIIPAMAIGV